MGRPVSNSYVQNNEQQSYSAQMHNADPNRIVMLHGHVDEMNISNVLAQIFALSNNSSKPIHLVISTYGGSVDEMFSLYDAIKIVPCPIHTIALGKVMSAGVLLLSSGVKGKRLVGANARIMIHPLSAESSGNIFDLIAETREFSRLQDQLVTALSNETSMSKKQVEEIMKKGHDFYITAPEAVELGIVDKIIGQP